MCIEVDKKEVLFYDYYFKLNKLRCEFLIV